MRLALVTDAWHPQISGVVRTLSKTCEEAEKRGHQVLVISPNDYKTIPLPTYPEIRLALNARRGVTEALERFSPQAIHIATEGPLGYAARSYCLKNGYPFTTAYCTKFPEYVKLRTGLPLSMTYGVLRRFHAPAQHVMVSTQTLKRELENWGFRNLVIWSRGVDTELFKPRPKDFLDAPRPITMYVGRVAVEKNIEAFLNLGIPGTKYVVGGGPDLHKLQKRHPEVRFAGFKTGVELAQFVAAADTFVFPSRTDTFGLVMLEALACGVPVAAYPVPGPIDVITNPKVGIMHEDLSQAVLGALQLDPEHCRRFALEHAWERSVEQFFANLAPIPSAKDAQVA